MPEIFVIYYLNERFYIAVDQQKLIQDMRFRLKIANEDKHYFEDLVLGVKKENKTLKEELMGITNVN